MKGCQEPKGNTRQWSNNFSVIVGLSYKNKYVVCIFFFRFFSNIGNARLWRSALGVSLLDR